MNPSENTAKKFWNQPTFFSLKAKNTKGGNDDAQNEDTTGGGALTNTFGNS